MATRVQFTVGKLDAGMAILLTADHHLIEFPSILLPKGVHSGSLIDIQVAHNAAEEEAAQRAFRELQDSILEEYGTGEPAAPVLSVRNTTQTSVVLEWEAMDLKSTELKSLELYKNGQHLGRIPRPAEQHATKISNLALDTPYRFHLVLNTTGGTFKSNVVELRTLRMTDLRGMRICAGELTQADRERLVATVERIHCGPIADTVSIETTHFACSALHATDARSNEAVQLEAARKANIPVVYVDYFEACEDSGRVMNVTPFYIGSANKPKPRAAAGPQEGAPREATGSAAQLPEAVDTQAPETAEAQPSGDPSMHASEGSGPVEPAADDNAEGDGEASTRGVKSNSIAPSTASTEAQEAASSPVATALPEPEPQPAGDADAATQPGDAAGDAEAAAQPGEPAEGPAEAAGQTDAAAADEPAAEPAAEPAPPASASNGDAAEPLADAASSNPHLLPQHLPESSAAAAPSTDEAKLADTETLSDTKFDTVEI